MNGSVPWLDRLAHDLRGPLAPLQSAVYLLRSMPLEPARQQELLTLIERQTRRLGGMIEEMGDWSRASEGRLLGRPEDCDVSLLLSYALTAAATCERLPPTVTDDSGEAIVHGDQARLVQLLRILLEYGSARTGNPAATVAVQVRDDALDIELVQERASMGEQQAALLMHEPMPEPYDEGLGLKLLIAKAIAQAHGGSLVCEQFAGGLRLHCRLPLVPAGKDQGH